jgi:thioesterase domain-containing protein/acyl carrier protein
MAFLSIMRDRPYHFVTLDQCSHHRQDQEALRKDSPIARRNAVEKTLTDIWKQVFEIEEVDIHDNFFRLGGDSLSAAEMMLMVQKSLGHNLSIAILLEAPTIARLAEVIGRRNGSPSSSSLVGLQARGGRPPFFCIHPVGGEVLCYANLARQFSPEQPFYGIRTTNLPTVGEPAPSIRDLAIRYVREIRSVQPQGPYYLGGYSFGGSVALEMAQELHAQGQQVALLAILDHTPPPIRYRSAMRRPSFLIEFIRNVPWWVADDLLHYGVAHVLGRIGRRARAAMARTTRLITRDRAGFAAPEVETFFDLGRMPPDYRRLLEMHYQALRSYQTRVYPGRVVLFRARTRPLFRLYGDDLGWKGIAGGGLKICVVPGNHDTMLKEPNVRYLAAQLQAFLRESQSQSKEKDGRDCRDAPALASQDFACLLHDEAFPRYSDNTHLE